MTCLEMKFYPILCDPLAPIPLPGAALPAPMLPGSAPNEPCGQRTGGWGQAGIWAYACKIQQVALRRGCVSGQWDLGVRLGEGEHRRQRGGSACAAGLAQQRRGGGQLRF